MLIMPRASNHKPSGKSATLRTSPSRLKTGGTKFYNNRINPISFMFNPRHALLLRQRRILCPRNSRGIDAQWMRHSPLSWTRTRTGRDRELPANWPQTRTGQNCGLALTSARPRTQTRTRPEHELDRPQPRLAADRPWTRTRQRTSILSENFIHPYRSVLCPHLIQNSPVKWSRIMRRHGRQSFKTCFPQEMSSPSCGKKELRMVPSLSC